MTGPGTSPSLRAGPCQQPREEARGPEPARDRWSMYCVPPPPSAHVPGRVRPGVRPSPADLWVWYVSAVSAGGDNAVTRPQVHLWVLRLCVRTFIVFVSSSQLLLQQGERSLISWAAQDVPECPQKRGGLLRCPDTNASRHRGDIPNAGRHRLQSAAHQPRSVACPKCGRPRAHAATRCWAPVLTV